MRLLRAAAAALGVLCLFSGCSSFEHHQYVFWGEIVPQHPETLEDHWSDYGPFLPNDRSLKMRRGKAGVVRFYKKGDYERSIPVDGELVVYVFAGDSDGVELTEPKYKLVIDPEKLNRQRKFDKKNGYSYHVWLDLGEIDQPPENISILSVFTETKSRDQVASGGTYTQIGGEATAQVEPKKNLKLSLAQACGDPARLAKEEKNDKEESAGEEAAEPASGAKDDSESNRVVTIDLSERLADQIAAAPAPPAPEETEHRLPVKTAYVPAGPVDETRPIGQPKLTFEQLHSVGSPAFGSTGYLSQGVVGGTAPAAETAEPNLLDPKQAGGATVLYQ